MKRYRYLELQKYLAVGFICLLLIGCGATHPLKVQIDYKTPLDIQPQSTLLAGAAVADITPPPGMPMGGHSLLSCNGTGVRNKLKARVIYIKPVKGRPAALVQVDLKSGSRIVHHRVAELVARQTDIDTGGLLIAGTHTHSAPGNYFGNNIYNYVSSNKKGFEKNYFEFLSRQIARAVIQAYKNRRPAKIATGGTTIEGVTANRSLQAYLKNNNKEKTNEFEAVNHYFHLIRVDCKDKDGFYKPIGAFSNFSIHSNTNPKELNKLYNGDVASYIERFLEKEIKRIYSPSWEPVHAVANYTHGDNNPFYGKGIKESFWDFEKVGRFIAAMALECFRKLDGQLTDDVEVQYNAKEIDMFKENSINGITIAEKPKFGLSALGGAQGRGRNSPLSYLPFFAPGWPRVIFTKGEHKQKRTLWPFQYLVFPKKRYPRHLFLQVIRVHDTILMAVPWEVTYEMGTRLSDYVGEIGREAGLSEVDKYITVSCANGYFGYVTTAEEYTLQYYEGGSNLYGPNTGKFLKYRLGDMVETLAAQGSRRELPGKWFFALRAADFYPKDTNKPQGERQKEDPVYKPGKNLKDEPYWSFKWHDVPPHLINFHEPLVSIEVSSDKKKWKPLILDGKLVNDEGSDISIHYLKKIAKKNMSMGLYQARWYNPPSGGGKYYRFVIQPRKGQKIFHSCAFRSGFIHSLKVLFLFKTFDFPIALIFNYYHQEIIRIR